MKNLEIEQKYKINEGIYKEIEKFIDIYNVNTQLQNDIYFSPIHFPFFGGEIVNECLRLRIIGNKNILGYKKFIPSTAKEPAHCIEHELEIKDIETLKMILKDLRIIEVFTLKKERKSIIYKDNVEISLDKVDNLGYFIELEIINNDNISEALKEIDNFLKQFNIKENMRNFDGYAYLLFEQNKDKLNEYKE